MTQVGQISAKNAKARRREAHVQQRRIKPNKVLRQISDFYKLGKDGMTNLKASLIANARDSGKTFKAYIANFWTVLTVRGGLNKVQKAVVLKGDIFAFA